MNLNKRRNFQLVSKKIQKKFEFLNQEIDGFNFKVISTLEELRDLAETMYNAAFNYAKKISYGDYLIMTITNKNKPNENYTNFGLIVEGLKLNLDSSVRLKMHLNLPSPKPIAEVFKKFADKNNITYDAVFYIDENNERQKL